MIDRTTSRAGDEGEEAVRAAAAWFVRRDKPVRDLTAESEFAAWLAQSPRHREEYRAIETAYQGKLLEAALAEWDVADIPAPAPQATHRHWPLWGAAAAVMLVVLVMPFALRQPDTRGDAVPASAPQAATVATVDYITGAGEQRRVRLADGSTVMLNGDTKLIVAFTAARRDLRLDRGEAFFDVAHDKARPFTVAAGEARFVALGTRFNVARRRAATELAVYEGRVAVEGRGQDSKTEGAPAGTEITLGMRGAAQVARFVPDERGDWRSGWLQTRGMTLADLADAIRRHSGIEVAVAPTEANLPVSGRFQIGDPDRTMLSIAALHDLKMDRQGRKIIVSKMTSQ